ncbi:MAG: hypothetical protein A2Y02_00470 [Omnitrophica bacterium GWA2_52_12]|nr:MAG: hypothetical protein A2Y02_00470 [Omnitrophica bacterium GWA2_52_12]
MKKANRLIHEKSPYLLQHAHNPVDWFPWGEEAFQKARAEDKPIFLSVGYSTCHWCHVMEEESFVDLEIAKLLNNYFISIKVDREERPDVDQVYMQLVQAMTGSGGWPMSVFLTHDLKPFYGGTYFPPEDRWGRPGFTTVLEALRGKWVQDRGHIEKAAGEITRQLAERAAAKPLKSEELSPETLRHAQDLLAGRFDSVQGGFGPAPKFPRSHDLSFLLRNWKRTQSPQALAMVEKTLEAMANGGIHDHLGGGFHRYATDARWHVPHFEKMLYDQALMAQTYLEAYQATGKKEYAETARSVFDYVLGGLRHPQGAFYSAEDADSSVAASSIRRADNAVPASGGGSVAEGTHEKQEGAFYIWSAAEIEQVLGAERARLFSEAYGVQPEGNAEHDPHGEFTGKNILYRAKTADELIRVYGQTPETIEKTLAECRAELLQARNRRPRPHLDDKILTDWNGLMMASVAQGARTLNAPKLYEAAKRAADFILKNMRTADGRLLHRWRDGEGAIPGFLDDYAFLIHGLIDLYQAGFEVRYLSEAKALTETTLALFSGPEGALRFTAEGGERMLYETQELYDGAVPSGNSIMLLNLIRLSRLLGDPSFEKRAEAIFQFFSEKMAQYPAGFSQALIALEYQLGPSREIVLAGTVQEAEPFLSRLRGHFIPNLVVLLNDPASHEMLKRLSPFAAAKGKTSGPAAYICRDQACDLPVTDPDRFAKMLEDKPDVPA